MLLFYSYYNIYERRVHSSSQVTFVERNAVVADDSGGGGSDAVAQHCRCIIRVNVYYLYLYTCLYSVYGYNIPLSPSYNKSSRS